ncbi:HMG (high mobility group) box protein [Rhizoctonia solani AG-3 Rhs1AP]|uniref:HMG (High mobility group) box protein n=2 Tax=Rhizoctonia solani AG-3 TaxID=1086053 RepID=A0A074S6G1_9AGAM|nr:HMG (high mobility group) box protein [Rhizoctonia solani AG-3 Rhs1AP]KEP55026.1 HMG (high mobility group) box protein [Rhizoctonia solani 123E]
MSLPTKTENSTPPPMILETLEEGALVPSDPATALIGVLEPLQSEADGSISRRPRNPFILFRTWYIKQGHLKQVTSSGSELSKITGKLWKAMHEEDRKFWAEQARLEREASQGRTYAPIAPSKPRGARNARKRASMTTGVRYNPLAIRAHDSTDERMDNIVQLIIAGKTGDELGGELRKKELNAEKASSSSPSIELPSLPLLAPVPRSARSSVSFDALEFQSQLSHYQHDQNSLSPDSSLQDLPMTPEQSLVPSGYNTPQNASRRGSAALVTQVEPSRSLNAVTDFTFGMASLHDRFINTEAWSLVATPDANVTNSQSQPAPTTYKGYAEAPHLVYTQGWNYYSTPVPAHGLNYPPGNYEVPGHPNYASYDLASTATWHGSEFVSPFDVPGHTPSVHAGDLCWPPEWLNDCY